MVLTGVDYKNTIAIPIKDKKIPVVKTGILKDNCLWDYFKRTIFMVRELSSTLSL
jgi:hypothetical protein